MRTVERQRLEREKERRVLKLKEQKRQWEERARAKTRALSEILRQIIQLEEEIKKEYENSCYSGR